MKTNQTRLNFSLITTLALLSLTGSSALAANWTITDLSALGAPGNLNFESRAYNINNAGQVAGRGVVLIDGALQNHYVIWSNGTQIDLGIRINTSGVDAAPINEVGQVAGVIEAEGGRPFLWEKGMVTRLPWLADTLYASVASINASGTVVGWNRVWRGGGQPSLPVRWDGGMVTELDTDWRPAVAINDSGAMAITATTMGQRSYVLIGVSTHQVEVPGLHPIFGTTGALDLNNAGQVCGWFVVDPTMAPDGHALLWQGGMDTPLPEFPSHGSSVAIALNNLGHVVGSAYRAAYDNPAVLWRDGTLISLSGTDLVLSFPTQTGVSYQLQSSTDLTAGSWLDVGVPLVGTSGARSANITIGPEPKKFFRLRVLDN
jgi:uncharacterized membrane protein